MNKDKLFTLINLLLSKTQDNLIQWNVWGTSGSDWGTPIGKYWVSISDRECEHNNAYTIQVLKDNQVIENVCTAYENLNKLYDLVKEKTSVSNKVFDELIRELETKQQVHPDSYYKD